MRNEKLNLDSKIAKIASEVMFEPLDLMHVEGVEPQTLVLVRVQLNLTSPQMGYREPFPFAQSSLFSDFEIFDMELVSLITGKKIIFFVISLLQGNQKGAWGPVYY